MKRFISILGSAILLAGFVGALQSFAADKQVTLTGTVSDSMCGAKHMMSGDDAKCTRACVKNGSQNILVVKDKVYTLEGKAEELNSLAGQNVTVVGTLNADAVKVASITGNQATRQTNNQSSGQLDPPAEIATIEGLVRDVACPIQNKEATARRFNLKCAQDCAKLGSPLVILTDEGSLYTPISESMPDTDQRQRLMPFLGKYVRVKGQVFERAGTRAIAIKEIVELKDVHLITDAQ